jgi:hypothetical protein
LLRSGEREGHNGLLCILSPQIVCREYTKSNLKSYNCSNNIVRTYVTQRSQFIVSGKKKVPNNPNAILYLCIVLKNDEQINKPSLRTIWNKARRLAYSSVTIQFIITYLMLFDRDVCTCGRNGGRLPKLCVCKIQEERIVNAIRRSWGTFVTNRTTISLSRMAVLQILVSITVFLRCTDFTLKILGTNGILR